MENEIYNPTNSRIVSKSNLFIKSKTSFDELLNENKSFDFDQFISVYILELENILKLDELKDVAQGVFSLDQYLEKIKEQEKVKVISDKLPKMEIFYQKLSPLFLRSLIVNVDFDQVVREEVIKDWKEILRVALEQEILYWKHQLKEKNSP